MAVMAVAVYMSLPCYASEPSPQLYLRWDAPKVELYQHQPVTMVLWLWTKGQDVRAIQESQAMHLNKGEFTYVSHAQFNRSPRREISDGEEWILYPVDSYSVMLDKEGKYRLSGGRYKVEVVSPVIVDDPFWGTMQTLRSQMVEIPVEPMQFDVKSLPGKGVGESFSGSVGNFKVDVTIPPGDIYLNEEATALITLRGPGWISDQVLPEYRKAFGESTRLKSFTEHRDRYLENGQLVSEVVLECTFIPTSIDSSKIGPVTLNFFNPVTREYATASSKEVKVKVKSVAAKTPSYDI